MATMRVRVEHGGSWRSQVARPATLLVLRVADTLAEGLSNPDRGLRWHLAGFRRLWPNRSRPRKTSPLPPETIDLLRDMSARGRPWGAERIRGELLKLRIR